MGQVCYNKVNWDCNENIKMYLKKGNFMVLGKRVLKAWPATILVVFNMLFFFNSSFVNTVSAALPTATTAVTTPAVDPMPALTPESPSVTAPVTTQPVVAPVAVVPPISTQVPIPTPDVTPAAPTPTPTSTGTPDFVVPPNFKEEVGFADEVAVGSNKNGELLAFRLDADGDLYLFDPYTMKADAWISVTPDAAGDADIPAPLQAITVSSDGTMCVLDANGKGWMTDLNTHSTLSMWTKDLRSTPETNKLVFNKMLDGAGNESLSLESISAGSQKSIWAVDGKNKNILQYTPSGWKIIQKGEALYVAAGIDNVIVNNVSVENVVALNEKGEAYRYLGNGKWDDLPGVRLARIAIGSRGNIWGIGPAGELYICRRAGMTADHDMHEFGRFDNNRDAGRFDNRETGRFDNRKMGFDKMGFDHDKPMPQDMGLPASITIKPSKENRWGKKRMIKKKPRKKLADKNARRGAQSSSSSSSSSGPSSATAEAFMNKIEQDLSKSAPSRTATPPSYRWVQVKGKDGALCTGWSEISVNAAGTVFAITTDKSIYRKGDRGFMLTTPIQAAAQAKPIEGTPVNAIVPAGATMTRDQAQAAGKIDVATTNKKQKKARKNPKKKNKRRLVKKTKKQKTAKQPVKKQRKKGKKKAAKRAKKKAVQK